MEPLGPATMSAVQFANYNQGCANAALSPFIQYLGFILLLQALLIIMIERLLMKIPRIAGKIERFYHTIVEDALSGKDPDVIEDITDLKGSEMVSRQRRKNEIGTQLKRSSLISRSYLLKNFVEILLLSIFIAVNTIFIIESKSNLESSTCEIGTEEMPNFGLNTSGTLFFRCEGKRTSFFFQLTYGHIMTMAMILICCVGSISWFLFARNISGLLRKLAGDDKCRDIYHSDGQDFFFLFDLLAHTAGIELTLRILSHSDENFRQVCQPKLDILEQIKVEEEKLKVFWKPSDIEKWLEENNHKGLKVASYAVSIFPQESLKTSVTKTKDAKDGDGNYSASFNDLQGGKTEYVITISCVIGRSRMKGEQITTFLLPYGPEVPRQGLFTNVSQNEVEMAWDAPKGGFTKYILSVDPNVTTTSSHALKYDVLNPRDSKVKFYANASHQNMIGSFANFNLNKNYNERELNNSLTEYKISGLEPGETYGIVLRSVTGGRMSRSPICETVLTKPSPVEDFSPENVSSIQASLRWQRPVGGNKKLKAFRIAVSSSDFKIKREMAVPVKVADPEKKIHHFTINHILPASHYTATIKSVCVFESLK